MGIRFACHSCAKPLNIKNDLAGKRGVCPACQTRFRIPLCDSATSYPVEHKFASSTSHSESRASGASSVPGSNSDSSVNASVDSTLDDPHAIWYVRPPTGGQFGPADSQLLQQWVAEGRVASTSLLWRDGWPEWKMAAETMQGLASGQTRATQLPATEATATGVSGTAAAAKNAGVAQTLQSVAENPSMHSEATATAGEFDNGFEGTVSYAAATGLKRRKASRQQIVISIALGLIAIALVAAIYFVLAG